MAISIRRALSSSLMVWLLITIFGVYFAVNFHKFINFGIDLVGGTYLTLEVQTEKLFENELVDRTSAVIKVLKEEGQSLPTSKKYENGFLEITFETDKAAQYAENLPINRQKRLNISRAGNLLSYSLSDQERAQLVRNAVESNISVLRSRVDQFGVGEVMVAPQGEKNIVIELPNVQDAQKAKAMIGTSALLEIKPILDSGSSEADILQKYGNRLPDETIIVPMREHGERGKQFFLVPRYADLTGRLLKSAKANPAGGKFGFEPVVAFELNAEGGDRFYEMTSKPNAFIAIILDGVVVTAATAREPLRTNAQIEGNFTIEEAKELAALLKSGAFMAPVSFEEDRTIGPSLGRESIHQGIMSCAIGFVLLLIFSLVVYKTAGLLAFIVLLYNLLLILFAFAFLGATLTLPGIAGMVLTVGMAIDASILIYERIREELAHGKPFQLAVESGFSGARAVILDANITHLLAAAVLYWFGAGPIQGFAAAMLIGIVSTLVTGLILLKSIFSFAFNVMGVRSMKI